MYLVNYVTDNILRCQLHGYKNFFKLIYSPYWNDTNLFYSNKEAQFAKVALISFT